MKSTADRQLLAALQQTVGTALRQCLDDNRSVFLRVAREAILEREAANRNPSQQEVKRSEFLTVAEVAHRWQLHPETVREMLRQGRIPRLMVGRRNRVPLSAVVSFEKSGAVPSPR